MRHAHCRTGKMAIKRENEKNLEIHRIGPGIWRETLKTEENEKYTYKDMKYGEKTDQNENEKLTW
jgi:hypothetical protein